MKAVIFKRDEDNEARIIDLFALYGVKASFVGDAQEEVDFVLGDGGAVGQRIVVNGDCGCDESISLREILANEAPHVELVDEECCADCGEYFDPADLKDGYCQGCEPCNECGNRKNECECCPDCHEAPGSCVCTDGND